MLSFESCFFYLMRQFGIFLVFFARVLIGLRDPVSTPPPVEAGDISAPDMTPTTTGLPQAAGVGATAQSSVTVEGVTITTLPPLVIQIDLANATTSGDQSFSPTPAP